MMLNSIAQGKFKVPYTQSPLPFAGQKMSEQRDMALQDRIRVVIAEMDGREYGKQTRLAELVGCARAVVNHWLSGVQVEIKYDHAKAIADKFGYRLDWIMEGRGPKREGEKAVEQQSQPRGDLLVRLSVDELKIIAHYRAANETGKNIIELNAEIAPKQKPDEDQ